jgi:hypothetical protein
MAAWRFLTTSTLCAASAALARPFLRLWAGRVISANRPGFYEARARALDGTGEGMRTALDDVEGPGRVVET